MPLQIRKTIHRDVEGYLIVGRPKVTKQVFPVRIFVVRRETAERMRDKLNAGGRIEMADFAGDKPEASEDT